MDNGDSNYGLNPPHLSSLKKKKKKAIFRFDVSFQRNAVD